MISTIARFLRRIFHTGTRYGVRHHGGQESIGFYTQGEAEAWATDRHISQFVVFQYEPIDLRVRADGVIRSDKYVP